MSILDILFDPDEKVCLAPHFFSNSILSLEDAKKQYGKAVLFAINPLKDEKLDVNCTAFRNFLVEFDTIQLETQLKTVGDLGLPFTSCVYSGGKSYHFIVALEDSLPSKSEYDRMVRWLFAALKGVDTQNKNPSRYSRLPGAIRPDTDKAQELIELRNRISLEELIAWFEFRKVDPPRVYEPRLESRKWRPIRNSLNITPRTREFLKNGPQPHQRNRELFAAACNLAQSGYSEQEVIDSCKKVIDFDLKPDSYRSIRDAFKKVFD